MFLLLLISIMVGLVAIYFRNNYTYWERKKIPSYAPLSITYNLIRKKLPIKEFYTYLKSKNLKHGGSYLLQQPIYMPIDPELLKQILTKDFEYFNEKGVYTNEKYQPITMHLFNLNGERWKKLRAKLTPAFTSRNLKAMFPTMVECTRHMMDQIDEYTKNNIDFDVKDIASKYTTDVIGSCAFGLDCNSFKNSNSEFLYYGNKAISLGISRLLKVVITAAFPNLCRFLGIVMIQKDVEQFYTNLSKDTLKNRRDLKVRRNDFFRLLMELREKENINDRISTQEIINQSFVFYIAGFESSSSVMTFVFLELCKNSDIQEKARMEILDVLEKHNNEITYDAIHDMKYLGQVIDETLRKYPPIHTLFRQCSKDYKIPGTDVILDAGTKVIIPVLQIHNDDEHYPEPDKFDPDRFSDESQKLRHRYVYLPFGEGPRQCIAFRFGLLQTKIGLITLLRKFKFALHPNVKLPVEFTMSFLALSPSETILMKSTAL